MPEQEIVCPNCGKRIALTDALMYPIEEEIRKKYEVKARKMKKQLEKMKNKIEKDAEERAKKELSLRLRDLEEQLKEKSERLEEAEEKELELRKQQRELEENKRRFELEMARKLDEERRKMEEVLSEKIAEEYQLKNAEYEKRINDMKKQIEDLKRKAEQTSQQLTGEVLELELEEALRESFPLDVIEPVPKGFKGADIVQRVYTSSGHSCGVILWETKRTKNWSQNWIQKLKDDQRRINADIAVLATTALPKDVTDFTYIEGVLVTHYQLAIPVSSLLRAQLMEVTMIKQSTVGRDEKIEILYNYLTSPSFRQKIEAIAEAFINMKNDLEQEQRAMMKLWAKREEQIKRAVYSIAGMYGEMQGILGASLPEIKSLNFPETPKLQDTEHLQSEEQ